MEHENFQHCLWLLPAASHPWHALTGGTVPAHLTLASRIPAVHTAETMFSDMTDTVSRIMVTVAGELRQTVVNGFYALEYTVTPLDGCPSWWPQNAHVSFGYRYHAPFADEEVRAVQARVQEHPQAILEILEMRLCSGHCATWRRIHPPRTARETR